MCIQFNRCEKDLNILLIFSENIKKCLKIFIIHTIFRRFKKKIFKEIISANRTINKVYHRIMS